MIKLGSALLLTEPERDAVGKILTEVKQSMASVKAEYAQLEEIILDVKTAEVHLLSPRAKTAVIREVLRALQTALTRATAKDTADRIGRMIA